MEANGTLATNKDMAHAVSQWNVSPKLGNSGVYAAKREVTGSLTAFATSEKAYFKFVLSQPADVEEVLTLLNLYEIQQQRVILMPQGTTRKAIEEGSQWVTELCAKHGFRFSYRMHILLWGDKRGR